MKIFIEDGLQIRNGTGIAQHTLHLYEALSRRDDVQVELTQFAPQTRSKVKRRLLYLLHIHSPSFFRQSKTYDVMHYTNFVTPMWRPKSVACVVTIHDLSVFLFSDVLPWAARLYAQFMIRHSLRRADLVLTDSETVHQELQKYFPKHKAPIRVTYSGIDLLPKDTVKPGPYENEELSGLKNEKFFLLVGTIEKRKNVGMLIDAFLKLRKQRPGEAVKLVLAGRLGFGGDEFQAIANCSPYGKDIIFTGYIAQDDRDKLYRNALAFVFPTVYEGFGTPQLECMRWELPIILSDIPVNREISGAYGVYFDLQNVDTLVDCMRRFLDGEVDTERKRSVAAEKLERFSWDNIAQLHMDAYQWILKQKYKR